MPEADPALLLGCDDTAIVTLLDEVNRRAPPTIARVPPTRIGAARWLEERRGLAAAILGGLSPSPAVQLAWIHVAHEQFGLVAPPGNAPPDPPALLRKRVRVASWPPSSDLRAAADAVLVREGLDCAAARVPAILAQSHIDIVAAVVRGDASIGITTASWAARFGLPFRPLGSRPLGLVAAAASLGHPALVRCWEVLQSASFRSTLEKTVGFDTSETGSIRYLRHDPPTFPLIEGPAQDPRALARWFLVARDRGQDVSGVLLRIARRLRNEGIHPGGFVQVPKRTKSTVSGYDLRCLSTTTRIALARRGAPSGSGPVLSYRSYQFKDDAFAKARDWLKRDASHADLLVLDGNSSREAEGNGHFEALAWAARLRGPTVLLACFRRDRLHAIVDRIGIGEQVMAVLEAPTDAAREDSLLTTLVAAVRAGRSSP